ncbi:MAG: NAD(P)H-hydrate dehydratase [Microscillaceae bacterium]|nr:NAD(P)H-hydrate dehydratase [Microscillaceae bacterium]
MKILRVKQIQALDQHTMQQQGIPSVDLMERASEVFVEAFMRKFPTNKHVCVFCGLGNNGGDGLAMARLLRQKNYSVDVWVVRYRNENTLDFAINYRRLKQFLEPHEIFKEEDFPEILPGTIIIDALVGSGLNRALDGLLESVVNNINFSPAITVSVDIASGLLADRATTGEAIIQPDYTFSFQLPKLAFFLPLNSLYVGDWEILDIDLDREFIRQAPTCYHYLDEGLIYPFLKNRPKFSHKGTYGHALIIGGSYGKIGAAILAANAGLHSGVGLMTVHVPACGYEIIQSTLPEAMVSVDREEKFISQIPELPEKGYSAIGIGCGLGQENASLKALEQLLDRVNDPVVLDADALNLLGANKHLLEKIPPYSILSPHPKEFERLTRPTDNHYERLDLLQSFAQCYQVFVVLKGAHSTIATPGGNIYFNSTGNPGMATGGSGDVLTGILTGLLAQGYSPMEATLLGVYLHGLAGDQALHYNSYESLVASDIIYSLGEAFKSLKTVGEESYD